MVRIDKGYVSPKLLRYLKRGMNYKVDIIDVIILMFLIQKVKFTSSLGLMIMFILVFDVVLSYHLLFQSNEFEIYLTFVQKSILFSETWTYF